jgi:hypothetical protein
VDKVALDSLSLPETPHEELASLHLLQTVQSPQADKLLSSQVDRKKSVMTTTLKDDVAIKEASSRDVDIDFRVVPATAPLTSDRQPPHRSQNLPSLPSEQREIPVAARVEVPKAESAEDYLVLAGATTANERAKAKSTTFRIPPPRLPLARQLVADQQPRTPITSLRGTTTHLVANSDPPRTARVPALLAAQDLEAKSEPRSTKWLGRGAENPTRGVSTTTKQRFTGRRDSFEDDNKLATGGPPQNYHDTFDTPTTKKGRRVAGAPLVKVARVESPSVDRLLHNLEGPEKAKQLRELAAKRGSERDKVYADYKGRGRYSESKPLP